MIDRFWLTFAALLYAEAWILGVWGRALWWATGCGAVALGCWLWGLRDSGR